MEASAQRVRAPRSARTLRAVHAGPLTGLITQLLLLAALAATVGLSAGGWFVGLGSGVVIDAALAYGLARYQSGGLRAADWVTLVRASLAIAVAALVADSFSDRPRATLLVSLAALALALDFVDGWIARRARSSAGVGAKFDGETDAFLILVLSVYVAQSAGGWVLLIGAARYAFFVAGWPLPWMRAPLPQRDWRKVVTAAQGIALVVAAADVLPLAVTQTVLVAALVLLAESFGRDVLWLRAHRRAVRSLVPAAADPDHEHARPRSSTAAAFTILAVLVVWAALVAPSRPWRLEPAAFARVPLEGLVLVALALVLPATSRRILAGLVGPALALVVILKILDIAFFTAFARPFDLLGDAGNAGFGIETLRAAIGGTEANLLVIGVVALIVVLFVATTMAVLRLTRVAASHRRWSLGTVTALGAVWLLCSISGAQFLPHTPIASTNTAGFLIDEVRSVQADIHDEGVFAKQIRQDPFRSTPGERLLTGLRGKDVLLVFVESYGRVAVQGSSFSPAIDALLAKGTKQLKTAGFSARSAFLTSSTFGGLSWLSHSTLQSGLWVNSQRRYNQLAGSNRFTLSDAFRRAGWRTINFAPADDRSWPEGSSLYHYDKLYDRRQLGYRGPTYNYAPMPDQYMFSALQRLELGQSNRPPLFAEVDTVSSHMPWNRIPNMIPWREVGNGSIFNRHPGWVAKQGEFWPIRVRVRAAYARSLEYSLGTLISFVQHYGRKNLVLIVAGDEQPLAIVTGQGASHDVVVSVIAHDASVLKRIAGWGWQPGLRPSPQAPVWRMSAFRDRFLNAFGSRSGR
jgi:phosphatidylglycerophosphate synthase